MHVLQASSETPVRDFAIKAKENIQWFGHKVSKGFKDHVLPRIKQAASTIFAFLRTGNGVATLLFGFGITIITRASCNENLSQTDRLASNLLGACCFAGGMALICTVGPKAVI
jgi:hypothetical protein